VLEAQMCIGLHYTNNWGRFAWGSRGIAVFELITYLSFKNRGGVAELTATVGFKLVGGYHRYHKLLYPPISYHDGDRASFPNKPLGMTRATPVQ
jgi:hypothetical protein